MNRDHLHQVGIALEPDLTCLAIATGGIGALLREVADQRVLAIELRRRLLKQLGEMKQVGEHSLATSRAGCSREQPRRKPEIVHQATQHRQHALFAPDLAIGAELHHPCLPGELVAIERLELAPAKSEQGGGECRPQEAWIVGSAQAASQWMRASAAAVAKTESLSDRYTLRTPRAASASRIASASVRPATSTARSLWPQRLETPILGDETGLARLAGIEQTHHLARADSGHAGTVGPFESGLSATAGRCHTVSAACCAPPIRRLSRHPSASTSMKGTGFSSPRRNRKAPSPASRASAKPKTRLTAATIAWLER